MKKLYHITDVSNFVSIGRNGLIANEDGNVFLFENVSFTVKGIVTEPTPVADWIATNQVFLYDKYLMVEVDVDGLDLLPDNVAEFTAPYQYIHKGNIPIERIEIFGIMASRPTSCPSWDSEMEQITAGVIIRKRRK